MTINERVFRLLDESHRTQKEFSTFIGAGERGVGNWRTRGSDPPAKLIPKISEFFSVSMEWLLTGEERPRDSFVNNGSVAGNLGPHTGTIIVRNGGETFLSEECAELVRVYESLDVRQRIQLLKSAFEIADGTKSEQSE